MKSETVAVHGGYDTDPTTKAVAVPIYQTVAYEFDSADHGAALFNLEVRRLSATAASAIRPPPCWSAASPRWKAASRRCASAPGRRRSTTPCSIWPSMGSNIVSVPQLYGTTHTLFAPCSAEPGHQRPLRANPISAEAIEKLIDDNTRAVFCESVGNPAGNICDIEALAAVAQRHGVPLIVDNTVATPILLRPIEYGADIVVHSLTKFMGGHGTTLGGAMVDSGKFPWAAHAAALSDVQRARRFLSRPGLYRAFRRRAPISRAAAASISAPPARCCRRCRAFLLLQGIETVALRVERHVENARRVAEFLRQRSARRLGQLRRLRRQPLSRAGAEISRRPSLLAADFRRRRRDRAPAKAFYDALGLIKRLVNIGDAKSLACHPASTTHRQMSADEQRKAGVTPEMIRLSVGIEHIDDIIADLDQALGAAKAQRSPLIAAE